MIKVKAIFDNGTRTQECANMDEAKQFAKICRQRDALVKFDVILSAKLVALLALKSAKPLMLDC